MIGVNFIREKTIILLAVAGLSLYSANANANTLSMSADVSFDTPLVLTKVSDIAFGVVTALNASTYKIDTTGAVSVTAGTGASLGGAPHAGNVNITGSTTATIDITTNNYIANNGVTPSAATCSYNGGAEAACSTLTAQTAPGSGGGKTLLVGATIAADGSQAANSTASPTFDIIVTYT